MEVPNEHDSERIVTELPADEYSIKELAEFLSIRFLTRDYRESSDYGRVYVRLNEENLTITVPSMNPYHSSSVVVERPTGVALWREGRDCFGSIRSDHSEVVIRNFARDISVVVFSKPSDN